jgi:hypothetical protein
VKRWWLAVPIGIVVAGAALAGACGDEETEGLGGAAPTGTSTAGAGGSGALGEVQILASDQHRPVRIELDGENVYWASWGETAGAGGGAGAGGAGQGGAGGSAGGGGQGGTGGGGIDGTVIKVPKDGGTPVKLASAPMVTAIVLDGAHVYWAATEGGVGSISAVSVEGGESVLVVDTTGWPADLAVDQDYLYWSQVQTAGGVWRMAKPDLTAPDAGSPDGGEPDGGPADAGDADAGAPGQLYTGSEFVTFLALDDDTLFFADTGFGTPIGAVGAIDLSTGDAELLAEELAWPWHLAVDSTHVYFATELDGHLRSVPRSGGDAGSLAAEQDRPYGVAVDESAVYWTNRATDPETGDCETADGVVMMVPLGGGEPVTLATEQACPYAIAVDDTGVYWVNHGLEDQAFSGSVMRMRKGQGPLR